MIPRVALIAAAVGLAALVLWHPARSPIVQSVTATPDVQPALARAPKAQRHHRARFEGGDDLVVYVAGAVNRPGLYHLHLGDRDAQAVALAGGLGAAADAGGVNLAQRAADGDEIYVPALGETTHSRSTRRASHNSSRRLRPQPSASIDVNRSDAAALAEVPGIGRAIAARIVELRELQGPFASLDELLDVAGMTASRLERARPYLRQP
jgi:competence protein ComEA